jgi:hypothetical protein
LSSFPQPTIKSSLDKILGHYVVVDFALSSLSASSASSDTTTHQMTYAPALGSIVKEFSFSCAPTLKTSQQAHKRGAA